MKVTTHRLAESGYDAIIIGFNRPCVISLYKRNVSPLCGSSANNDQSVFRYSAFNELPQEQMKNTSPKDYPYVDNLTINDFYEYFSTIDLSHLTHDQHKALYTAVAEINDITSLCCHSFECMNDDIEELERCREMIKRTDNISVDLDLCEIEYADGEKSNYQELHN